MTYRVRLSSYACVDREISKRDDRPHMETSWLIPVKLEKRGTGIKGDGWRPQPPPGRNAPGDPAPGRTPRLTVEESAVVRAFASGKTDKQICSELRIPLQAFYRLLRDLKEKTGASDRVGLLVWSLRQGPARDKRESERDYKWRPPS
jgi:DNA-binding CsgD family transcriptional regulator